MNKKANKVIALFTLLLLVLTTLIPMPANVLAASPTLADGEYEIDFTFLKDGTNDVSVMDDYAEKPAKLKVENGNKYVELTLKNSSWIQYLKRGTDETGQDVDLISEDEEEDKRVVGFVVEDLSADLDFYTHVIVPMINYDNKYQVQLKFDTESLVEVNRPTEPEEPAAPELVDGEYTIDFSFLKSGTNDVSVMDDYAEKPAKLKVENGNNYVELTLKNSSWIQYLKRGTDETGQDVDLISEDEEEDKRVVGFVVEDLSADMNFYTHVIVPMINYDNKYQVQLKFDTDSLVEAPTDPEGPSESTIEDGKYTINFRALHSTQDKDSSMKDWILNPAILEVENGRNDVYLTVQEKPGQFLTDIRLEIDGQFISQEIVSEDEASLKRVIKFEVPKLGMVNAEVDMHVVAANYQNTQKFRMDFEVETVKPVDTTDPEEGIDEEPGEGTNPGPGTETPGNGTKPTPEKPSEETFTIDFKVLKDGTNTKSVMDEYTHKPAELKVKDGRNYISLTLVNSSWIKEFKVEGSSTKVISENSKTNTRVVQFEVANLSKKVNASTHVVIPASEFPGGGSYDNRYTVQIEFDPSSKKPLKGSIPAPTTPETPTPSKAIRGADGGKVEGSGAEIEFPKGVFGSDFNVSIQKISNPSSLPLEKNQFFAGNVLEITKDKAGDFKKAITITLSFDKTKVDSKKHELGLYWYNESTKKWIKLDNIKVDFTAGKVSGEVNHFTKFAVVATEKIVDGKQPESEQPEQTIKFKDVKGHWAEEHIYSLVKQGVINGYPTGEFRPNHSITRAEFATILVKTFDLNMIRGDKFTDTKNHWANDYIITAEANGIIKGYNDKSFGPNDLLTREQMAVMIARATEITGNKASLSFTDTDKIAPWAKDAVEAAVSTEIITGYPNQTFKPKRNATRAEAVTVVIKALN